MSGGCCVSVGAQLSLVAAQLPVLTGRVAAFIFFLNAFDDYSPLSTKQYCVNELSRITTAHKTFALQRLAPAPWPHFDLAYRTFATAHW